MQDCELGFVQGATFETDFRTSSSVKPQSQLQGCGVIDGEERHEDRRCAGIEKAGRRPRDTPLRARPIPVLQPRGSRGDFWERPALDRRRAEQHLAVWERSTRPGCRAPGWRSAKWMNSDAAASCGRAKASAPPASVRALGRVARDGQLLRMPARLFCRRAGRIEPFPLPPFPARAKGYSRTLREGA